MFLEGKFVLKNLGRPTRILNIQIEYSNEGILLHQSDYARDILSRYEHYIGNGDSISRIPIYERPHALESLDEKLTSGKQSVFRSMLGAVLYLSTSTRPDLAYASSALGRFNTSPCQEHFDMLIRVMKYIRGTSGMGIKYYTEEYASEKNGLTCHTDSDHAKLVEMLL
jgi:hypothetical protein